MQGRDESAEEYQFAKMLGAHVNEILNLFIPSSIENLVATFNNATKTIEPKTIEPKTQTLITSFGASRTKVAMLKQFNLILTHSTGYYVDQLILALIKSFYKPTQRETDLHFKKISETFRSLLLQELAKKITSEEANQQQIGKLTQERKPQKVTIELDDRPIKFYQDKDEALKHKETNPEDYVILLELDESRITHEWNAYLLGVSPKSQQLLLPHKIPVNDIEMSKDSEKEIKIKKETEAVFRRHIMAIKDAYLFSNIADAEKLVNTLNDSKKQDTTGTNVDEVEGATTAQQPSTYHYKIFSYEKKSETRQILKLHLASQTFTLLHETEKFESKQVDYPDYYRLLRCVTRANQLVDESIKLTCVPEIYTKNHYFVTLGDTPKLDWIDHLEKEHPIKLDEFNELDIWFKENNNTEKFNQNCLQLKFILLNIGNKKLHSTHQKAQSVTSAEFTAARKMTEAIFLKRYPKRNTAKDQEETPESSEQLTTEQTTKLAETPQPPKKEPIVGITGGEFAQLKATLSANPFFAFADRQPKRESKEPITEQVATKSAEEQQPKVQGATKDNFTQRKAQLQQILLFKPTNRTDEIGIMSATFFEDWGHEQQQQSPAPAEERQTYSSVTSKPPDLAKEEDTFVELIPEEDDIISDIRYLFGG